MCSITMHPRICFSGSLDILPRPESWDSESPIPGRLIIVLSQPDGNDGKRYARLSARLANLVGRQRSYRRPGPNQITFSGKGGLAISCRGRGTLRSRAARWSFVRRFAERRAPRNRRNNGNIQVEISIAGPVACHAFSFCELSSFRL